MKHFFSNSCYLQIIAKSSNLQSLLEYTLYLKTLHNKISINNLPIKIKKLTVLKSPHVNKKSREQFEIRYYKRLYTIPILSKQTFNKLQYTLFQNIPATISLQLKLKN